MSNTNLDTAISSLQQNKTGKSALKALITIRSEVEWPKHKQNITRLRESGCLKEITAVLLSAHQKQCVDLALSILGNCLMDRTCTVEVVTQHNIISVINQLLKKHGKEDSINGRTFRVIGNMCQHRDQWAIIIIDKKPLIINHLVDTLKQASKDDLPEERKISEATVTTALRALRELQNSQTIVTLIKQFGVLKALGAVFIKYSERWQKDKHNEKMVLDIIKVIYEFSRFKYYHSILEMRNTERGDSLIHLSSVLIVAPRKIVKIVMNFIKTSQLKSELPIPEICSKFIEVLEKHSIIKEFDGHCAEYLQCLCYLLDHPANRNQERCGKAVMLLIKLLNEFQEVSNNVINCCTLLIHTLNKFKYDDKLMLNQLSHGIIPALTDKLTWLVGPPDSIILKHLCERKRKYIFDHPMVGKKKLLIIDDSLKECSNSPSSSDDEVDIFIKYQSQPRSPSPCSSSDGENVSWSEPGSPNRSLVNDSDSDDYSPVCSEAEEVELPHDLSLKSSPSNLTELDEVLTNNIEDDSASEDTKNNILKSLKQSLGHEIVRLLKSLLKHHPNHPHFASAELLTQLTKWALSDHPSVKDFICDLIKCHEHLIPLMKTRYIETLNAIRTVPANHDGCSRCLTHVDFAFAIFKRLTETAESAAGKGEIAHQLMRGDQETKEKLVLAIPYIVSNRSILCKLMLNCAGLEVLMSHLHEDVDQHSLKVLVQMASKCLNINNPTKPVIHCGTGTIAADQYRLADECVNVVCFEFENGVLVRADRDFLAEQSEFFNGLLNGHFKESRQSNIELSNVNPKSFRCLLHLLQVVPKRLIQEIDLELETLLDVILLCDRYLLTDLCVALTDSVQLFRISVETVPMIYNWSVESGTNLLRIESVAFALVAAMDDQERYEMFRKLFDLEYREQLVGDVEKLLKRYLRLEDFCQRERDGGSAVKRSREMRSLLLKQNLSLESADF
ncbi:uncharacterized protein Rnb isoform X2 [Euwallacea similis]|uniref:uncharacterized protein Rnb isoform X2 n=2 Tax=Euwallacea similis TaxID=1736056 RepID=UPI0034509A92